MTANVFLIVLFWFLHSANIIPLGLAISGTVLCSIAILWNILKTLNIFSE